MRVGRDEFQDVSVEYSRLSQGSILIEVEAVLESKMHVARWDARVELGEEAGEFREH